MTTPPAREPSEWDDDPAWSRPDPMTAEEREAWLDHLTETDEPPEEAEDSADFGPLTAAELAGARDGAAAGPAVWAGPGRPAGSGAARVRADLAG
jgi:hypothetical protein